MFLVSIYKRDIIFRRGRREGDGDGGICASFCSWDANEELHQLDSFALMLYEMQAKKLLLTSMFI